MRVIDLLDRPIAFHRSLAALTGSVTAGLMLSQALYWSKRGKDPDGWFYKTQEDWHAETYLSRKEQETARRKLRELGDGTVWQEELRGVPATLYFRLDMDKLEELLLGLQYAPLVQSSMPERGKLECPKGTNKHAQKGQTYITETTTETTTEKAVHSSGSKNPHYDCFAAAYRRHYEYPYIHKHADFVQYNKWKKTDNGLTDEAQFEIAVRNYFDSPQKTHTFAHLVTQFAVFRKSSLDRFGKPSEERQKPLPPSSAAPPSPKGCDRCVQGWVMPGTPDNQTPYAKKCDCQKGA